MSWRRSVALLAVVLAGCANPVPTKTPPATANPSPTAAASIDRPTGPNDLVLRMSVYEWPWPVLVVEPAEFSMYGDGLAIYFVRTSPNYPSPFELRRAQLTTEQVDALVRDALDAGGLATANSSYDDPTLVDRETTIFEIHAAGLDKTVSAFALSEVTADPAHAADRAKLRYLSDRLGEFAHDVAAGRVTDLGVYRPLAYRATLAVARDPVTNAEWPWPDFSTNEFEIQPDGTLIGNISRADATAAIDLGIAETLVAEAPNGTVYRIQIQPMLPDETRGMLR